MPVPGGLLPAQGAQYQELTAITRRAFIPKLIVQIYGASPLAAGLLATAQSAGGGVSSVTVPVQGAPFVSTAWSDYSGSFAQPTPQQGAQVAEFNLKLLITPIPFLGTEGLVQMDHAVIPLVEARMNDAGNSMMDVLATALYGNTTNAQQAIGLDGAIDDGTNLATYGNINRTAFPFWKSKVYPAGAVAPTRKLVHQYIVGATKFSGGEAPTFGVTDAGTWANLAQDFIGAESYQIQPGNGFDTEGDRPRSAFRALDVGGVPIYFDPYVPTADAGTLYLPNSNYLNLYVHDNASFSFSGFESVLSNFQIGYIGVVITACELVCVKPKAQAKVTGFTSLNI